MQADTVMPTQSAPQASVTPQPSYGAPVSQTAAQAPAVATSPQWVAPQQAAVAPAPQVQAQMGTVAPQYNPTQSVPQSIIGSSSGEPIQGRIQQGGRAPEFSSANPFLGQQSPATQEYGQANYSSPQAPLYNNQGQQISAFEREQPGILQQLFPNFAGNQRPAAPRERASPESLEVIIILVQILQQF